MLKNGFHTHIHTIQPAQSDKHLNKLTIQVIYKENSGTEGVQRQSYIRQIKNILHVYCKLHVFVWQKQPKILINQKIYTHINPIFLLTYTNINVCYGQDWVAINKKLSSWCWSLKGKRSKNSPFGEGVYSCHLLLLCLRLQGVSPPEMHCHRVTLVLGADTASLCGCSGF